MNRATQEPRSATAWPASSDPRLDEHLASKTRHALQHSHHQSLRKVSCECHEGTLTLRGQLPSFYLVQLALTIAGRMEGVRAVVNRITVAPPAPRHARSDV